MTPRSSIMRHRLGEQLAGGGEHDLGLGRRGVDGVRAGDPGEVVEAQPQHDRAPDAVRRAQPSCHAIDDADEHGVELLLGAGTVTAATDGVLRADRPAAPADLDASRVTVVGEGVQMAPGERTEDRHERALTDASDVGDGRDAAVVQLGGGLGADAPQPLDRERVQERQLSTRRHDQQPVRLGDAARHLGEELRAGDTHRDRQAHPLAHLGTQPGWRSRPAMPDTRRSPPTSRKASSIDSPSTSGVVSSNTPNTALLASLYAVIRGGTATADGHSRSACRPPIAVRTPKALAS